MLHHTIVPFRLFRLCRPCDWTPGTLSTGNKTKKSTGDKDDSDALVTASLHPVLH